MRGQLEFQLKHDILYAMTTLEKRLVALSALGIRIEHEAGHRWILSTETDCFDFEKTMKEVGVNVCKLYGGINEALNQVDTVLAKTNYKSLEEYCNTLTMGFATEDDFISI